MRISLYILLLITISGCSDMPDEPKQININSPDGELIASESAVESFPQEITVVTGSELIRLQSLPSLGPDFVTTYLGNKTNFKLKNYDQAFRVWQLSGNKQHSNTQVIEILGGYFGNKCLKDFNMEWVTITDEYGTDFAVRDKTNEVMIFPFSTVMKRIEDDEYDFLYGVYYTLKQTLETGDFKQRENEATTEQ